MLSDATVYIVLFCSEFDYECLVVFKIFQDGFQNQNTETEVHITHLFCIILELISIVE